MNDLTNPEHYKSGTIEAIEVIEAFDLTFRLANVIKYVLRADKKENALLDLKKALWYLNREIWWREKKNSELKKNELKPLKFKKKSKRNKPKRGEFWY